MNPVLFLAACLVSIPTAIFVGTVAATWWYNAYYLPRIVGAEDKRLRR